MDFRGVEISVGDLVYYPTRKGSAMTLREGEVIAVEKGRVKILTGGRIAYPNPERMLVW